MLTKDDAEHPIPEELRPFFRKIASALAAADFCLLSLGDSGVLQADQSDADRFQNAIEAYGAPLTRLSDATWTTSIYRWMDDHWDAIVDLSTVDEAVSDLAMHVRIFDERPVRLQLWSVHVP